MTRPRNRGRSWPGSGEPLPYAGHVAQLAPPVYAWMMCALTWIDENIHHARRRATARQVVVYLTYFLSPETLEPGKFRPFVCVSQRQLAEATGLRQATITEILALLATGPLKPINRGHAGRSAKGACYELVMVGGASDTVNPSFSVSQTAIVENSHSDTVNPSFSVSEGTPTPNVENFPSDTENGASDTENGASDTVSTYSHTVSLGNSSDTETTEFPYQLNGASDTVNPAFSVSQSDFLRYGKPENQTVSSLSLSTTSTQESVPTAHTLLGNVDLLVGSVVESITAHAVPPRLGERGTAAPEAVPSFEEWAGIQRRLDLDADAWERLTEDERRTYSGGYHAHITTYQSGRAEVPSG